MKASIGITCSLWARKEEWIHQEGRTFDHLKREYYQLVEANGGVPIALPNVDREETINALIDRIDGLLLSGGDDIDPSLFGEENLYADSIIHPHRDRVEIAFAKKAAERGMPIFGICRGHQLINVAFGGTLWQDSSLRPGTDQHKSAERLCFIRHPVKLNRDSHLYKLAGSEGISVSSRHHQHIKDVAENFTVGATSPDGIVEAIERIDRDSHIMAVQWHPESNPNDPVTRALFQDFIRASEGNAG